MMLYGALVHTEPPAAAPGIASALPIRPMPKRSVVNIFERI